MTRFVDTQALASLLARVGTRTFMAELAELMKSDYVRWHEFDKSARLASHSDIGVIELMPIADASQYAFKYVNGHPSNTQRGLSTVMAFGALADVDTGFPTLLSELTLSTGVRTAVASAVAAEKLARADARTMGLIGCGAQSEFQAIAFESLVGIEHVKLYDVDAAAVGKLERNLRAHTDLEVEVAASAAEAAERVDVLTTATADKAHATIVTADMLSAGLHINGVGGDCPGKTELAAEVLEAASVFVEYEPQTRIEGDIQQMPESFAVTELWSVLAGEHPGRLHHAEVTVFDSVGFALEDYSMLKLVHRYAESLNIGEQVDLVPTLDDNKDLFGLIDRQLTPVKSRTAA
ncbi:MAG: ornithine cyclodeaminase [Woeseiaceae bacterium]|nr:ornithine cyclodeaminase [Woeseiaceae bacterium]